MLGLHFLSPPLFSPSKYISHGLFPDLSIYRKKTLFALELKDEFILIQALPILFDAILVVVILFAGFPKRPIACCG